MQRRWRVPPPPDRGLDAADGAALLEENAAGLGVLLWDVARDVVLWASSPASAMEEIFAPAQERMRTASLLGALVDPVLEESLLTLAWLVGQPQRIGRERVATTCRRIAQWADERGALATAAAFLRAAAAACPGDATIAYEVGRVARRRACYREAEAWLKRAALLGRYSGEWSACINARGGLGNLHIQRGNYPKATKHHRKALWLSRKLGIRELEGQALHSLCIIAIEGDRMREANSLAREASVAFGSGHHRLPTLAHDIAYGWMREGYFARALEVFEAVLPFYSSAERVQVLSDICRAAAGVGDVERFELAWQETEVWMAGRSDQDRVAEALLDMARGAAILRRWDDADTAARRSMSIAASRGESRIVITAETLLDEIQHERLLDARHSHPDPVVTSEIDALSGEILGKLPECVAVSA